MVTFTCIMCSGEFEKTGKNHKRCPGCKKIYDRDRQRAWAIRTGKIKYPGVGKGGATHSGEANPMWKNGLGRLKKYLGKEIRATRRYCEACSVDLIDATHYQWCIHHINHDTSINTEDNLMLLCKRCHQIYHKCWTAFERATTRSNP